MTEMVFGTTPVRAGDPILPRWWRTVDRWSLACVLGLCAIGLLLGLAASVPLAEKNGLPQFYYVTRQAVFGDMALVALAGPLSNLAMALGWALVALFGHGLQDSVSWLGKPLMLMGLAGIDVNVMLGVLNLVPIPPLDGSRVLAGLLPDRFGQAMARMEPYGLMILLFLLISGVLNLLPVVSSIRHLILTLFFA